MKRDTIFYRIFQQSPALLLDLLPSPPADRRVQCHNGDDRNGHRL